MSNDWGKINIPMIRNLVPGLVAKQIVGVQPMSGQKSHTPDYQIFDTEMVDGEPRYSVQIYNQDIWHWLRTLPKEAYGQDRSGIFVSVPESTLILMALQWKTN